MTNITIKLLKIINPANAKIPVVYEPVEEDRAPKMYGPKKPPRLPTLFISAILLLQRCPINRMEELPRTECMRRMHRTS